MTASPAERPDPRPVRRLAELADYIIPFTLRAVCDLAVADHLAAGPRTVEDLAARTGTHAPSLYRALRALAGSGVFTEVAPRTFALTELAQPLRSDHPASLRAAYPLLAADIQAWARYPHSLRTGESAFEAAHGRRYWDHLAEDPAQSARFDASQRAVTLRETRDLLPAYDWAALGSVVDVGGGDGTFLAALLEHCPSLRGTLLDQPRAVDAAGAAFSAPGVRERAELVAGDYRVAVPAGADAYVLKRTLYDLRDEVALRVLRLVRAALPAQGRVLVIEPLLEPGDEFSWGRHYDLLLLVMAGGGSRQPDEIAALFDRAGLRLARIIRTGGLPIIEGRPV